MKPWSPRPTVGSNLYPSITSPTASLDEGSAGLDRKTAISEHCLSNTPGGARA